MGKRGQLKGYRKPPLTRDSKLKGGGGNQVSFHLGGKNDKRFRKQKRKLFF